MGKIVYEVRKIKNYHFPAIVEGRKFYWITEARNTFAKYGNFICKKLCKTLHMKHCFDKINIVLVIH